MIDLLSLGHITSYFGNRNAPTAGASYNHNGIDIVLNNKNVPAVVSGTVIENTYNNARGYYITIKDSKGYTTRYQHLASQSSLGIGAVVKEGDIIGTEGSTGISTGSHLHFEVKDSNGNYINPMDYLNGATNTVINTGTTTAESTGLFSNKVSGVMQNISVVVLVALMLVLALIFFLGAWGVDINPKQFL